MVSRRRLPLAGPSLTAFFRGLLRDAMSTQRVESTEPTEFYLVKLLEGFLRTDRRLLDRPLALDYLESFHASPGSRYTRLKHVGDTALFVTGMFMERLERTLVGVEYYAALGRLAYAQLSAHSAWRRRGTGLDDIFAELAARFPDFVRVLAQISTSELFASEQDTLRIYRRWLHTRGGRDAALLVSRGIIPVPPGSSRRH